MSSLVAVLDACILYPPSLRDFLLSIADGGYFQPKWSKEINGEWTRNFLKDHPDCRRSNLVDIVKVMNDVFPDSNVQNYKREISRIKLPDPNDAHVLAAAIKSQANVIVTNNLKDFPKKSLEEFQIKAKSPDDFVSELLKEDEDGIVLSIKIMRSRLVNPPLTAVDIVNRLRTNRLFKTALIFENRLKDF